MTNAPPVPYPQAGRAGGKRSARREIRSGLVSIGGRSATPDQPPAIQPIETSCHAFQKRKATLL